MFSSQAITDFAETFVAHCKGNSPNFKTNPKINALTKTLLGDRSRQLAFCELVSREVESKLGQPISFTFPVDVEILDKLDVPEGATAMLATSPSFKWGKKRVFFIDKSGIRLVRIID